MLKVHITTLHFVYSSNYFSNRQYSYAIEGWTELKDKTISEDNTDFTDNSDYSLKLKDGTTIDFCSQIDESLFDLASPGVKGWFYRNYWKKKIWLYGKGVC